MFPNIFTDDAFSLITLTGLINEVEHVPGRAGELAFAGVGQGVATLSVAMEQVGQAIGLIQTSARGAAAPQAKQPKGSVRNIGIPQVKLEDTIGVYQVQDVRELGSTNQLRGIQSVINSQMTSLAQSHDLTLEHLRLGALQGQVLDADGSLLYDLYSFFGVTAPDPVSFIDVFVATPDADDLETVRTLCQKITRFMVRNAKAVLPSSYQIHALCGDNFFDKLIESTSVKGVWDGWAAAERKLGGNYAHQQYLFADIMFENYRGTDDQGGDNVVDDVVEGTVGIAPDDCRFFLTGVPGLYKEFYAPADFAETANTLGLPRYAKIAPDNKFNREFYLHTQQNPLPICTRPRTLVRGISVTE